MNRIDRTFADLKARNEAALVGFVTAGDPSVEESMAIIRAMIDAGVDVLELGVPFSDPTADGPTIQRSSQRALKAGVKLQTVFDMTAELRRESDTPIVLFSYYNPILTYGGARFYDTCREVGADGVLLVDLPPEESDELTSTWSGNELSLIRLVAPTTPPERMKSIAENASGFVYLVSMTGVTGSGGLDVSGIGEIAKTLAGFSKLPIAIGFGISTPEHAKAIAAVADGVVVGSAFERVIEDHLNAPDLPDKVAALARSLKGATAKE